MKAIHIFFSFFLLIVVSGFEVYSQAETKKNSPNILWITSEDNGPFLGCYGDEVANTPHLDALASAGIRYTNCFANAPVCAPTRCSWILGMPAISTGTFQMRSRYRVPDELAPYPVLMKQAGYYVTNNSKTDYNTSSFEKEIWDECGKTAHYRNRPEGKPFFAVFNIGVSHEGQIFESLYPGKYPEAKTPGDNIEIPPYQVNTPEVLRDWRRVYDRIEDMDREVGRLLKELEELGEAENTLVFYNSDHGGITLRSKRFLFDSGTRVPCIIYVPQKWKSLAPGIPGEVCDRLVQFIDMPKTFLSLIGAEVPDRMSGKIFMGNHTEEAPQQVLLFSGRFDESPDMSRAITDGRWKYIRNYESDRPRYQMLSYPWSQSGQVSQFREYLKGNTNEYQAAQYLPQPPEELYDTQKDPHEINNLVYNSQMADVLYEMRKKADLEILAVRDVGFIPEPMMAEIDQNLNSSIYEFALSEDNYPLDEVLRLANLTLCRDRAYIPVFKDNLRSKNPVIRYWAMLGLRLLGKDARPALFEIKESLKDHSPAVRIQAAICMGNLDMRQMAMDFLIDEARKASTDAHANWALDGLKYLGETERISQVIEKEVVKGPYSKRSYDHLRNGGTMYYSKVKNIN